MALSFDADANRSQLRFGTEGLPAREELLLKSLIRILDYRTHHQWSYQPESADLWLLAEGCKVPPEFASAKKIYEVLQVGGDIGSNADFLNRPLRSDQIEATLNRVGSAIASARAATLAQPSETAGTPPPSSTAASAPDTHPPQLQNPTSSSGFVAGIEVFRLTRWPNTQLLNNSQRIRLATIMLGRPLSLAEIVERSHLGEDYCLDFITALKTQGLVVTMVSAAPAQDKTTQPSPSASREISAATEKLSLFARIRNRLNIKNLTLS